MKTKIAESGSEENNSVAPKAPEAALRGMRVLLAAVKGKRAAEKMMEQCPGFFHPKQPTSETELVSSHSAFLRGESGVETVDLEFQRLGRWLAERLWSNDHNSIERLAVRLKTIGAATSDKSVRTRSHDGEKTVDVVIASLEQMFEAGQSLPNKKQMFNAVNAALTQQRLSSLTLSNFYRLLRQNSLGSLVD
jgi:hypothetical protein